MDIASSVKYKNEIEEFSHTDIEWGILKDKVFLISGATGMIASYLIDLIMHKNREATLKCKIIALGRNEEKARKRFSEYFESEFFDFFQIDINNKFDINVGTVDYILHAASNTHPIAYATDPIGTIKANVIGLNNLLEVACKHSTNRFVFLSSVEIYGENRGDVESFSEKYCGYIDCNTLRAGYPESKRVGEALCQAYLLQKNLDVVIPRLSRVFGPTMQTSDSKALSQFLKKALEGENIVLKSDGSQFYSYTYVSDAVFAILRCMFYGKKGEAYNVSNEECNITLKELAICISNFSNKKVVFEVSDKLEKAGYSTATKAILNGKKIAELGWQGKVGLGEGIKRTLTVMKE